MTISLEALKKQARQESRSGALSYTQALEQLSQRHGFRTFAALKASSAKSSAVHAQSPAPGGSGNARLGGEMVGLIIIGTIRDDPHPISMDQFKAMGGKLFKMSFPRCLVPGFDGVVFSREWKEALWDRYVMAAPRPRTPCEQQYSDRRLRSRR